MGWFDEQIRLRKKIDDELLADSFIDIAGAVMGSKVTLALQNDRMIAKNAIDEILKFFHIKSMEVPSNITDLEGELEYLLRPYGIMRREVKLVEGWYKDAYGAMLGIRKDDGSPVAFLPTGKMGGYICIDGKTGAHVRVTKENQKLYEKEAIVFYKPFPLKALKTKDLVRYVSQLITGADILMVLGASLMIMGIGLLMPWINRVLFSEVITTKSLQVLMGTAIFLICMSISKQISIMIKNVLMVRINTKISVTVEAATMMRIMSLPSNFFKNYSAGELATKIQYLNQLCDIILSTIFSALLTSIFSLVYIIQIFQFAPALTVPSLIMIFLVVIVTAISAYLQMMIRREQLELTAKENGMSFSMISGIQKIRLTGAEKRAFARWGNLYAEEAKLSYDPPLFVKTHSAITMAISLFGMGVLQFLAVKTGVSQADYYAFNTAFGMVNGAFMSMAGMTFQIAQIRPVLEQVRPIMNEQPEISENKVMVTRLSGGVDINNVSFRYQQNMPLILDNLSLKIRPGQYVAIVGKTGCGKSTLVRLLIGFEKPQKGAIYYDGKDMQSMDLKSLRKNIGVVTQNGSLFQGDIYGNIVISAPELGLEEAWEAAEMAGMKEDIEAMPMGMFTMVSEGGGGISGGQRQRIMIARAIAPKPKILIFDEATSALDNITQKIVTESLNSLKCTRIVIAHRLSTIKNCDRILVMDQGKIIEDGTYEELIRQNGFFAELVERQRLDVDTEG